MYTSNKSWLCAQIGFILSLWEYSVIHKYMAFAYHSKEIINKPPFYIRCVFCSKEEGIEGDEDSFSRLRTEYISTARVIRITQRMMRGIKCAGFIGFAGIQIRTLSFFYVLTRYTIICIAKEELRIIIIMA